MNMTELYRYMSKFIGENERVFIVETVEELELTHSSKSER